MAEKALLQHRWREAAQLLAKAWGEDTTEHILDIRDSLTGIDHFQLVIGSPVNKLDLTEQILLSTLFANFAVQSACYAKKIEFMACKKLHKLFGEYFMSRNLDVRLVDQDRPYLSSDRPIYLTYSWFLARKEVLGTQLEVIRSKCWGNSYVFCQPFLEAHKSWMQPSHEYIVNRLRSCHSRKVWLIGTKLNHSRDIHRYNALLADINLMGKSFRVIPYSVYIRLDMMDVASILLGSEKVVTISSTLVFLAGFLGVPCEGLFNGLPMNALHGSGQGPSSFYPSVCYLNEVSK